MGSTEKLNLVRDIVLAVLAALARAETQKISARVKSGMARARAQGKQLGRPKVAAEVEKRIQLIAPGHGHHKDRKSGWCWRWHGCADQSRDGGAHPAINNAVKHISAMWATSRHEGQKTMTFPNIPTCVFPRIISPGLWAVWWVASEVVGFAKVLSGFWHQPVRR